MMSQFSNMTSLSFFFFFWCYFLSHVKFSYWSMFHDNIITGAGVMGISFYKRLTRSLEIRNTLVVGLPNIWRLGQVRTTKFGRNVSSKILLRFTKCQDHSFYCFCVIKGKPTGVGAKITPPPPPYLHPN